MLVRTSVLCALALVFGTAVQAGGYDTELLDALAPLGCTVGPPSVAALAAQGFNANDVADLGETAIAAGQAARHGQWIVLGPEICEIELPDVDSAVSLTDPDIAAAITRHTLQSEYDRPGCYLIDGFSTLRARPSLSPNEANEAYLKLLAAGIISGDLRFYSESPLATPLGFQVMTGDCANFDQTGPIFVNHSYIADSFGTYIRALGAATPCEDAPGNGMGLLPEVVPANLNAWLAFEFDMITMGAGWWDGISATKRGRPRPPLCHIK